MAVSPRYCAAQKVQTGSAAAGGHRRVATRETGDLATRRGAGDPETRAEWMTVLRCGHLRSAPVVVDVGVRTGWEPPTLRAALSVSTRPTWAPSRWRPASPTTRTRVCAATDLVWLRARRSKTSREMQSEANEDREDAETSCVQRSISPLLHALAGCGRRCATLSR